jgi:aminomethyltransferase
MIARAIANGPSRRRVGLLIEGKAPAREGAEIMHGGKIIGRLTSGGFSPSLGRPIAMGYVEAAHAAKGESVEVMLRGKPVAAKVAATPFVPHKYHGGA